MKKLFFLLPFCIISLANAQTEFKNCTMQSISNVYDGDTFTAKQFHCGGASGYNFPEIKIRIYGIDTPEKKGKNSSLSNCEIQHHINLAEIAQSTLENYLTNARNITVENVGWGKYGGRLVATILADNNDVSDLLIQKNLGVPYFGKTKTLNREKLCQEYFKSNEIVENY